MAPGLWCEAVPGFVDGTIRPSKVIAKAFNAGFQRTAHFARPRPVGSSRNGMNSAQAAFHSRMMAGFWPPLVSTPDRPV